jgi:hypothetical protein
MTEHTPGPWRWSNNPYDNGTPYIQIIAGRGIFGSGFDITGICSIADGRLMAAAPELLASIETLVSVIGLTAIKYDGQLRVLQEAVDGALAVIHRAKGTQPATGEVTGPCGNVETPQ